MLFCNVDNVSVRFLNSFIIMWSNTTPSYCKLLSLKLLLSCPHMALETDMTTCKKTSEQTCCCMSATICCSQVGGPPPVNLSTLSLPRIPPSISTIYWSSHFTVGGWRAEEGSLLWFTWTGVQSKTLSACGCFRQWKVHLSVNVLHDHQHFPPSSLGETCTL